SGTLARNLVVAERQMPLSRFAGQAVHGVAGIGNPTRFFDSLRAHGLDVVEHPFPDHHAFVHADLDFGDDLPVLMTEKDAVKCIDFATAQWWSVPVEATLPSTFLVQFAERLTRAT